MTSGPRYSFRWLEPDEAHLLVPMVRAYFESGALFGSFDEKHFLATIPPLVDCGVLKFLMMSFADDRPIGVMGCFVLPHILTGQTVANELVWYVDPAFPGAGAVLLREGEKRFEEMGVSAIQMTALAEWNGDRIGRLYERKGYRKLETNFIREIPAGGGGARC